ncbi:hypothetical protein Pan14r_12550 [Crateriforma conspicua]|uniref:Uncharacterized protein n=1 Tax=Crateriforma conspicua TaxID=2527996 RepID=A0A5C5Y2R4_9PLAN|nr:hypothetical protein Mal65_26700 [Crateriforma conspicua]TWT68971.1 hypothetical protein Pan14r_12550 [Crateriforma conspicua]
MLAPAAKHRNVIRWIFTLNLFAIVVAVVFISTALTVGR